MRLRLLGGAHMHRLLQIRDTGVSWQSLFTFADMQWDYKE
jgi:hypothetical protein